MSSPYFFHFLSIFFPSLALPPRFRPKGQSGPLKDDPGVCLPAASRSQGERFQLSSFRITQNGRFCLIDFFLTLGPRQIDFVDPSCLGSGAKLSRPSEVHGTLRRRRRKFEPINIDPKSHFRVKNKSKTSQNNKLFVVSVLEYTTKNLSDVFDF